MKNKSELLLEGYFRSCGYTEFDFEPQLGGTSKRPDYRLRADGTEILLEVKELRAEAGDFGAGFGILDPYPPLREKINAARDKFKGLKKYCCCLVLYNVDKPLLLLDWQHVYGAMLGNVGFSVPLDLPGHPVADDVEIANIFMSGGKMHRERGGVAVAPQNQTISAVLVLGRVPVGERLFHAALREREAQTGQRVSVEETIRELDLASLTPRDSRRRQLRVVVHENPYARIPLPRELFRGSWDERYGSVDGRIQQIFQGNEIGRLPASEC